MLRPLKALQTIEAERAVDDQAPSLWLRIMRPLEKILEKVSFGEGLPFELHRWLIPELLEDKS